LDKAERVMMNDREVSLDEFLIDGANIQVERGRPCRTVGEALRRLGMEVWLDGGRLQVKLNGEAASADTRLADSDAIDLSLKEGPLPSLKRP